MIYALLAVSLVAVALVVVLVLRDQMLRQMVEDQANERILMLAQAREERADLLQRIQAPEQAVISHAVNVAPEPVLPVEWDNDDDAYLAREAARG